MSCSICKKQINEENAPIIAMGGMGNPRYICDECAAKLDVMTESADTAEIRAAISSIADIMSKNGSDDVVAHGTVKMLLAEASLRADSIDDGSYTESDDESGDDVDSSVPEELLETDEDRELDRQEQLKNQKLDKIFNWISLGVFVAAVVGIVLFFVLR